MEELVEIVFEFTDALGSGKRLISFCLELNQREIKVGEVPFGGRILDIELVGKLYDLSKGYLNHPSDLFTRRGPSLTDLYLEDISRVRVKNLN